MKVSIDATSLLLRSAGVKNYVHYWLASLQELAQKQRNILVGTYPPGIAAAPVLDHESASGSGLRARIRFLTVQFCNMRGNPFLDFLLSGSDVFHASQHVARLPRRIQTSATVFDLSCWITPENHTPENIAATRRYGEKILKACDGLIAISAHTRRDTIEILGIPEDRIRVIYPGVAEPFFEVTREQAAQTQIKYGLFAPYLLFVGCIEPRKNVPALIQAYRRLPELLRRDVQLVIAGPFGWASESVRKMLTEASKSVRYLGYVPEQDLPGLFRGASALVYPSQYEGFGFPAAQAMAAGVPVIASDCSCLPEVVGGGGLFVPPRSVDALSDAMERVLTQTELAQALSASGKLRAAEFHWSRCAAQSLEFFNELAGN
jgi:glycosyltransferase involved in cell wall biosynthesis